MADPDVIRARVQSYVDTMTAGDRAGWLACFAEGATMEDPVGSPVRKGEEEIGAFFDQTMALIGGGTLRLVPDRETIVCGNEAALVFHTEVTMGDQTLALDIVDVFGFDDDGFIASQRAFVDMAKLRPI